MSFPALFKKSLNMAYVDKNDLDRILKLEVVVNGKTLKEYSSSKDDKKYIEANLFSPVSYFIEEEIDGVVQKYPSTPFVVRGTFYNIFSTPAYLKLSVDSRQIWMKPFPPGADERFCVRGYKNGNEVRELLFTLPSFENLGDGSKTAMKKSVKADYGTIKVEILEGISMGYFHTWKKEFRSFDKPEIPYQTVLNRLHKTQTTGATTRDGRVLSECRKGNGMIKMMRYELGKEHYGEKVLHYRTRPMLQDLGIDDPAWHEKSMSKSKKKEREINGNNPNLQSTEVKKEQNNNKDNCDETGSQDNVERSIEQCREKMMELDVMDGKLSLHSPSGKTLDKLSLHSPSTRISDKLTVHSPSALTTNKMSVFSPSGKRNPNDDINGNEQGMDPAKSHKVFCFSPNAKKIKAEEIEKCKDRKGKAPVMDGWIDGKEYRMIEIDQDLCILEEVDDDVVWMGDDSCCFMDVTPPNISLVDLCEDGEMAVVE